ncbi:hypothetical protein [Odoribacter splanchnicus]|uniref:hypothetical protein n=1 Tax=Odoribacter splanchnicus TaxID=28118 RepID=UPI000B388E59|nr:hypothetical protein [Odoribacter splanchnicus]OUO16610.1 hypothetical protein B5F93_00640 [Odoribacter splanchnicus]
MSAIFISEFSSLNFRKDWKLSFQQNVDYIPKFLPTDNIQVQYVVKDFTLTPYLKNICTGEVKQLSPVLLLENESEKCYQLTINNSSISSDTEFNLYFASDQDGEKIKDANFCVCTELPDTILLEYTNRKNVYETIFDGIDRFLFRVEGAFLPQEISFENNTEEFRDQRYVSKILSSTAFEKKTLTLGGGMGVPNWVARKINLIFSLSSVHVEGTPMVRSDGGAVELTEIGKYYPLYIYKIVLEDGEDNEDTGDGIIEYLRAVDEKKKIIRKSSENDLRVYLEGTGIDTAKMIRELELIGELSMNYTIEIDDNLSGSTNKTTLQSLIQFISKDFVTNNKFKEYIDQPVRTTDDVKFNSVVAKESIKTGKVTAEEVVSENFTSGLLGVGHRLWNGVLEISELIVRKTMHVFEIIVQKVTSVNGSMLTTPGGGVRISEVEELEDGYKCLFNNDDGTIPNPFIVGDQALHQVFTGKNIGRYWRLVTEVGDNYFVLSKTDCEAGSGIPQVEDEIIQFGNRTDKNRQNAVLTTSYGSDAPYTAYYSNVNSYSLEGKEDVREGNLRGINDPDFGQLQGSGFYGKNVYLKGIFRLLSGKTVEESIGDVQSNLDNLQVGETNLLDNSNKGWKNTGYPIATIYLGDYKPKKGEECTIVIKGKLGANKTNWAVYNSGGNVILASFYPGGPDTDYIALKTFKWTLTPAIDNTFIRIYPMPNSVSVESEIEWVKLVLGNKTSLLWTPSINDQKQIAIDEAGKVVDGIQIGSQNLISKKMMLKWNEKNKDIAVWGEDEDGVYLAWDLALMRSSGIATGTYNGQYVDIFENKIKYKTNTQYVISIESKSVARSGDIFFYYTDGSRSIHGLSISFGRIDLVSTLGKTVEKICFYIGSFNNPKIYNISLIEGNKPLQGFPVAAEDQIGANNVNLADGTKGPFTVEGETNDYAYKALYMPVIKPNTVYYVNAQNIEFLSGNISKCDFILFDKAIKNYLTPTYHHLYDKNGGILITKNDFEAQEGYLLCYAGESGHTAGNSVRFTEVMLVEGFLPAPVWTPSFSEQQAEIKTITKTITEIKAENGEISLRVNEVSERVEEAKQEAIDTAKEYTTLKTYRETEIDLRAEKWDQDTYYPVTIKIPDDETRIEVYSLLSYSFGKPSWSTHDSGFSFLCVWRSNGSGWGANVVNRIIEVFEYRFTKEIPDTTPVQYIPPAGSIGQLISSSEELIYLRGGGRYIFRIGNNCVAVVHDSRYTAPDGSSVAPAASVIRPVLTNATKEELNAEINITKGLIENKVSLDVYNENDQLIKSDISNLQVSYNQISSTVSKIINGTQEISGVVTQSNFVTIFSSNKNALGQEVIESINVGGGGVTIDASRINLNGAISANGNVQITTDGKLIAVNGQFTGKITATEGEIAGLKLSNNGLRSSDFNASSKIGSCYAKNGFSVYASGSGVLAPSTGMLQAGIITATGTQASITGLEIIAKNTSSSATVSEITALKLRAIDYVDDSIKMAPTAALIVEEGVSIFRDAVEIAGKSTFRNKIYLNLASIPNISGASNYYLCINRSTGQLSYR